VDIFIIHDQRKTNIEETLTEFNKQPTTKFTTEKELHNSINFLDLSIYHREKESDSAIYRKSAQTDIIIPNDSGHPYEHKISSINYLLKVR
jgi:hypothetical protein